MNLWDRLFAKREITIESVKTKSRHDTMVEFLEHCENMLGKSFSIRASQVVRFETITTNILVMNAELRRLNKMLHEGKNIGPNDAVFEYKTVTLAEYFIDEKSQSYINQNEFREFHLQATIFARHTLEGSKADYGMHEHNYRVLAKVVKSIIQICKAFDEANKLA